jgi:hypothetical protein
MKMSKKKIAILSVMHHLQNPLLKGKVITVTGQGGI